MNLSRLRSMSTNDCSVLLRLGRFVYYLEQLCYGRYNSAPILSQMLVSD